MKTQKQLGSVHLKIEGLDKDKFRKLVEGHNVWDGEDMEEVFESEQTTESALRGIYIENCIRCQSARWVVTDELDKNSKLIALDELEEMLVGKEERTPEVIQAEMNKLQAELIELTKVEVGDVVISGKGHIFRCEGYDASTQQALSGHTWHWGCTKIDPNKTVKEILGL